MAAMMPLEEDLSRARATWETKPTQDGAYVRMLECEVRFLRQENRNLRAMLRGAENVIRAFRFRKGRP